MKTMTLMLFCFFVVGSSQTLGSNDVSKYPHIVSQKATPDGGREIHVHNPLDKAVWLYIECENVISVEPIGVPGRHYSEIRLKSNEEDVPVLDNTCFISHWNVQTKGGSVDD